jgi:broad specificity phosphatase PhoE
MIEFFAEIEEKYKNKNILVITHHLPTMVSLQ